MRIVPDKNFFSDFLRHFFVKFRIALAVLKTIKTWHGHTSNKFNLLLLTKYNRSYILLPSILKFRNSVARKGIEVLNLLERAYPNPTKSPQSEDVSYTE